MAKELIDFDHKFSRMFSAYAGRSVGDDTVDPAQFQEYFVRQSRFTAGTATHYPPSVITGESAYQKSASGFTVGMRFHSAAVVRMSDAKRMQLGHVVRADGRWRIFAFADCKLPSAPASRLRALCEFLEQSDDSPVRRYTPSGADIDSVIEAIAVCQQTHGQLSFAGIPSLLLPRKGRYRLIDYEKVYCPDLKYGEDIFDLRGIDRNRGALIVVRPDQYVAHVLPLDAYQELAAFFRGFLLQEESGMRI